jgi:hypothetical protein
MASANPETNDEQDIFHRRRLVARNECMDLIDLF